MAKNRQRQKIGIKKIFLGYVNQKENQIGTPQGTLKGPHPRYIQYTGYKMAKNHQQFEIEKMFLG